MALRRLTVASGWPHCVRHVYAALGRTPEQGWYLRSMTGRHHRTDPATVDQQLVAEVLPGLYRAVLDAVADLERHGRRHEAAAIRADASRAYAGAWNPATAHRLRVLTARAARILGSRRARRRESMLTLLSRRLNVERPTL
jgi:hypothetical protein